MTLHLFLDKFSNLLFNEKKIRIYGPLAFGLVLLAFFQLPMLMMPDKPSYAFLRIVVATIIWVLTIWEPTRFIILKINRHKWHQQVTRNRILLICLFAIPITLVISILRIYIEHTLLWKLPVQSIPFLSSYTGTSLLFVIAEIAFYETIFYLEKWHQTNSKMRELEKANIQLQYDALKLQIQPHFLFNTLNTLIGLMKIDTKKAIHFTEEMAYVYRYLLQSNDRQFISLSEEIRFTNTYFNMLKTRYTEGLHLQCEISSCIENYSIPPLSLQILLENAVKHNVITKERPLYISINLDTDRNTITVSNNLQKKNQTNNTGLGLLHLENKFALLRFSDIIITKNEKSFSVTLPLLKSNSHECYHS